MKEEEKKRRALAQIAEKSQRAREIVAECERIAIENGVAMRVTINSGVTDRGVRFHPEDWDSSSSECWDSSSC